MKIFWILLSGISIFFLLFFLVLTFITDPKSSNPGGMTSVVLAFGFIGLISALLSLGKKNREE